MTMIDLPFEYWCIYMNDYTEEIEKRNEKIAKDNAEIEEQNRKNATK